MTATIRQRKFQLREKKMNETTKFLTALGAAATLLLAACATPTPPPQGNSAADATESAAPARHKKATPPAANTKRAPRGTEIQTTLVDYTHDGETEYRVLGQGEGETDTAACDAARKKARDRMAERIDEWTAVIGAPAQAQESEKNALRRALRESAPDPWEYDDGLSPRFRAYFGVSLEKSLVEETQRKLEEKARERKRLPAPLDNVFVENARFPAKISGMSNVFKEGESRTITIEPEIAGTLTIFCYNEAGDAVVVGIEIGGKTRCALRPGEAHERRMSFSVEDPAARHEESVLLFVLTTQDIPFDAAPGEVFPCTDIAKWLSNILPRERFVEAVEFTVER